MTTDKLCEPLKRFRALMLEHIETTNRFPLLSDLSFLQSDKVIPGTEAFVKVIRKLLSSHASCYDDRPLDKCERAMIEGLGRREILQAVLAKMFSEVAFSYNSQDNEDMTIWKESLTHSFNSDVAAMMMQDWRLRKMNTPDYRSSRADRVNRLKDQLTKVFHPLTDRYLVNVIHHDMAEAAADFWGLIHAYNGEFEMIWPRIGSQFCSILREDDTPGAPVDGAVLWVMEPGVAWLFPTGWRICSKARILVKDVA